MIKPLLKQWFDLADDQQAVLCSVVEWNGSVPRKDYPLMLVLTDGSILGTIGGGSMELKVTTAARALMGQSKTQLLNFDMTGTDVQADIGLCGGTLNVLVEPFSQSLQDFYSSMMDQMSPSQNAMVMLSVDSAQNYLVNRQLISQRKELHNPDDEVQTKLQNIFENQKSQSFTSGDHHYLMWQPFSPPTIHIFGAGHVGQAVADIAHFNELSVNVYDDRTQLLTPDRFPYAQLVSTVFPIKWGDIPPINSSDFVLIASREHRHDHELLTGILKSQPGYVGLVSSSRKWKILSESLLADGVDPKAVAKVHAPVGLNIDAQTVPEIAISILSEMIATYRGVQN